MNAPASVPVSERYGRVGVLYGGLSAEREISLMSGQGVHQALLDAGVDAHLFDTGQRPLQDLLGAGFDRVFIALHGRYGEDGTVQGLLELMGLPYTGSGLLASSLAMDKIMTKKVWLQAGLPTPAYLALQNEADLPGAAKELGLPLIVKPPHEGSTLGLTKVTAVGQMQAAYRLAARYEPVALAEQFIPGRELTVPVLGKGAGARALPVVEIVAPQGNYDYENKYFSNETRYLCPAPLEKDLAARVRALAEQAYRALGCEGWGRADFMLDEHGQPWLLEMNTSPGMTSHSLVPMSARAAGLSYADLCLTILDGAACKTRRHEN
jgi:D-alanine-D-alanine ligase